jgi:hypothetical protein
VFAPQGIVLPTAIFAYFLTDFGINRSPSENLGTAILFGGFVLLHTIIMLISGCFGEYYWSNSFVTVLMGLLVGGAMGVIGWGVVRGVAPDRLPSKGFTSPQQSSGQTPQPPPNPLGPGGTPNAI